MTQVTLRKNGNNFSTWKALNHFGIPSNSFKPHSNICLGPKKIWKRALIYSCFLARNTSRHMSARLRWLNTFAASAFANATRHAHKNCKKKTNMPSIGRSFYLLNTCTVNAIFLYNWTQCIEGFNRLLQGYVRRGNDAKNLAILSFFFVTERPQLNAAHKIVKDISKQ